MIRFLASACACVALALFAEGCCAANAATIHFDIKPGRARSRLNEFAAQSKLPVFLESPELNRIRLPGLHGDFAPLDALDQLIAGTTIRYSLNEDGFIVLDVIESVTTAGATDSHDRRSAATLDEVVVTGRPADRDIQKLFVMHLGIRRDRIDAAGFGTVQDVLRTLPQIFGGGPTEDTFVVGTEARTNTTRGTGINIRGLGAASTLVLMNGRRLPGAGTEGLFVDVSNLPLSAVERIDLLPDSMSTFFGADAPGGVANFVMRDRFKGIEAEAGVGSSTRGGDLTEHFVSQIVGGKTSRGHGVFAFELYTRGNLPAAERPLARSDLTEYGGSNFDSIQSNPGNISLGGTIWSIPRGQDGTSLKPADFGRDSPNLQDQFKGSDILLNQKRWSVFGTWRQELTETLSSFTDVLVGQRDVDGNGAGALGSFTVPVTNAFYASPVLLPSRVPLPMRYNFYDDLGPQVSDARVRTADVTVGLEKDFGDWIATASVGYASERTRSHVSNQVNGAALNTALARSDPMTAFNPFGDGSHTSAATLEEIRGSSESTYRSSIASGNLLIHGPLISLPGGPLTLALGGDMRQQGLLTTVQSDVTPVPTDTSVNRIRNVHSAFAEIQVPLIGKDHHLSGAEALSFSVAERYEHYSDFGSSLATRYGLSWTPRLGVTVRSTYSESYRPPGLLDLDESNNAHLFTQLPDPLTGKPTIVMVWAGKNQDLTEENAHSWTTGVELESQSHPGSAMALTYFRTQFTNRLSTPVFSADLLSNPTLTPLVTLNPSASYRELVCSRAPQSGSAFGDCLTPPIGALIDLRLRNDAQAFTEGLDLLGQHSVDSRLGSFSFEFNGTYVLRFSDAKTKTAPLQPRVSTPHNPTNFRARSSVRWARAGFGVSASASYQNHYVDTDSLPRRDVSSWTTTDVSADYQFAREGPFAGTTLVFRVENLFDKDPPFLNNAAASIGYDQENGDLTGRVVSFHVRKKW